MPVTTLFRSDGGARSVLAWSSSGGAGGSPVVKLTTQDNFTLVGTAAGGGASRCTPPLSRRNSNRDQLLLRLGAAAGPPPPRPAAALPPEPVIAAVEPDAVVVELAAAAAEPAVAAVEPAPVAKPAPAGPVLLQKFTVNIDALDNYELVRYIPVVIEPLGDRVFVAEVAELNLSITGQTPEDAVQLLKELLVRMYEGNRSKRNSLDTERRRQQRTLETYIGRPKGTWHWA